MGKLRGKAKVALATLALAALAAGAATAATIQKGDLRITLLSQILPYKLPRDIPAPIAVFVSGHVDSTSGGTPPQLERMAVKVNRHGLLQSKGLPVCNLPEIQPGSTERALNNCADALVGSGRFWAQIVLEDQRPYPTRGRLLVFNGRKNGHPVLFAHIFTTIPFASSFVITFSIKKIDGGAFGTELKASLPQALGDWGYLDRIKLTLRRKYDYRGRELSYFNANCPTPKGTPTASFPLALADFDFGEDGKIGVSVVKSCRVKG